jgi:hypothetical protein|nr:MAG TPA: hypothetical protein [Caudoviricetes sp.]DAS59362.1 MAG TPA: hypothetical protein [Caudoviricetes sp.]
MSLELITNRIKNIKAEISSIRESSGQLFLEKQNLELRVSDIQADISRKDESIAALQNELNELIIAKNTIEKYDKQGG